MMPTPKQKLISNPILTHMFVRFIIIYFLDNKVLIAYLHFLYKQTYQKETKMYVGVMNEFLLWCRHRLVPFFHIMVASLSLFQRNDLLFKRPNKNKIFS